MLSIPIISEPLNGGVPRRRSARHRIETLVYADLGPGNGGFPINVGEGGMAFQGIQPLEKGRILCIKFKLPDTNDAVETTGQVAWLNELGKGGGLQFIDLSEEYREVIHRWLSQQTQAGKYIDDVPVGIRKKVEKQKIEPSPPLRTGDAVETKANSIGPVPAAILSSAAATGGSPSSKLTARSPLFADVAQTKVQGAETKRTSMMPFAIGLIAFVAVTIAIMSFYGVISVQFRWPQKAADEISALPASESSPETTSTNTLATQQSAPVAAAPTAPPATTTQVPAPEKSPESTGSRAKIDTPKRHFQITATAKPMKPTVMSPATSADFVPPPITLPAKSELAPQPPMIFSRPSAPAPPTSVPSRQSGKLDAPQLIRRINPVYPEVAKTTGISGSVELQFTITAEGKVRAMSAVRGNPILVRAAVDAVKSWRYEPARIDGKPVETQSSTIINFKVN